MADRQKSFGRIFFLSAEYRDGTLTDEMLANCSLRELVELYQFEVGEVKQRIGKRMLELFGQSLDSLVMVYKLVGEPTLRNSCYDRGLKLIGNMPLEESSAAFVLGLRFYKMGTGSRRDKALKLTARYANTFGEHMQVYGFSTDPDIKRSELAKCCETAVDFTQLCWVQKQAGDQRQLELARTKALEVLMAQQDNAPREDLRAFLESCDDEQQAETAVRFYIERDWFKLEADNKARAERAAREQPLNAHLQLAATKIDTPNDDFEKLLEWVGGQPELGQLLCQRVIVLESARPGTFTSENLRLVWGVVQDPDLKRVAGMLVNSAIKRDPQQAE